MKKLYIILFVFLTACWFSCGLHTYVNREPWNGDSTAKLTRAVYKGQKSPMDGVYVAPAPLPPVGSSDPNFDYWAHKKVGMGSPAPRTGRPRIGSTNSGSGGVPESPVVGSSPNRVEVQSGEPTSVEDEADVVLMEQGSGQHGTHGGSSRTKPRASRRDAPNVGYPAGTPANDGSGNGSSDINSIAVGQVVYHIPDTMVVYSDYDVTVRISRDGKDLKITNAMSGRSVTAEIKTTARMEVDLLDSSPDSSFYIKKINANKQIVDTFGYTEWKFTVRPIKHGKKSLNLVISIILGHAKKQIVYTDNVHVKDSISKEVGKFWKGEYKWLFSTFLIPIFIYFWKRKGKKEKDGE